MDRMARGLCVSPEGGLFAAGTAAFHRHLAYDSPDFDLTDYAVRNMGYILLVFLPHKDANVRCRPRLLTVAAVRRSCQETRQRNVAAVRLDCVHDLSPPAHWANYRAFVRRLGMSHVKQVIEEETVRHGPPVGSPKLVFRPHALRRA